MPLFPFAQTALLKTLRTQVRRVYVKKGFIWLITKMIRCEVIIVWAVYALLSAFFAALTSILAKIGIEGINSNLATAIRTIVVLFMAWAVVIGAGSHQEIATISRKNWIFLILSGFATGFSWLFYFKALQMGEASKVVPVDKFSVVISMVLAFFVLNEVVTVKVIIGGLLITVGTLVLIF